MEPQASSSGYPPNRSRGQKREGKQPAAASALPSKKQKTTADVKQKAASQVNKKAKVSTAKEKVDTTTEKTGTTAKEKVDTAKEKTGYKKANEKSATSNKKSDTSKGKAGTSKEKADSAQEKVAGISEKTPDRIIEILNSSRIKDQGGKSSKKLEIHLTAEQHASLMSTGIWGVPGPYEPTCICKEFPYGDMIGCDDEKCPIEWYHIGCTELASIPMAKWFCSNCKPVVVIRKNLASKKKK